jgi:hypothetical protein
MATKIVLFMSQRSLKNPENLPVWPILARICRENDKSEMKRKRAKAMQPPSFNMLSADEVGILRNACTSWLSSVAVSKSRRLIRMFLGHLVVLTLVSVPPPRAQIFSKLEIGKTLVWDKKEKTYSVSFDGIDPPLKTSKPLYLLLPPHIGRFYQVCVILRLN